MKKINVGLMGYGSQGRRIAEALRRQTDMVLTGVGVKAPDLTAKMAYMNEHPLYAIEPEEFKDSGIPIRGSVEDLLSNIEVVVDATPAGIGKQNKEQLYAHHHVKGIFQGGESFDVATIPVFFTEVTYESASNAKYLRIPTPYTVATVSMLEPMNSAFGVKDVSSTFLIAGSEPNRGSRGPLDAILPVKIEKLRLLKEEIGYISLEPRMLSAFRVPTVLLSVQTLLLEVKSKASKADITALLREQDRILLLPKEFTATDMIFEFLRRVRGTSGDIYEICVWEDQIECDNQHVKLVLAYDNHCVHTPHIIDAIRALTTHIENDVSSRRTNNTLNVGKKLAFHS
ncbi:MAG: type II glyceraldehyde-3-phosphate dehydrogenase [Candidatus Korarchaeota archaeon]|nr:type II glyceraldehyde-3-phosphate dehydrogenase [Candidatus Korarchaeota archaeon]NIU82957.1 type II glyceraldehyde-3-phosphate dehydrogenase [Candidatus Thorarchaeota archaeon]NIW13380.1 type II glyceraldehyde-3-phosphate dehydrogenase [Candidatus Thorarchaeota archaeon]NIW51480.1 type II glyceraldehyde-3-phosphate dehydrogenase [Candidatus Korarchaeota archaeon]